MEHEQHYKAICEPAFKRIEKAQTEQKDKLNELIVLLQGYNNTPGFLERVRKVEERNLEMAARIQGHHDVLFGIGKETPGVVDDIRDQQRRQERAAKVAWTMLGAIIVNLVIWIRRLFTGG